MKGRSSKRYLPRLFAANLPIRQNSRFSVTFPIKKPPNLEAADALARESLYTLGVALGQSYRLHLA